MPKASYENLEDIPETLRDEYHQIDGDGAWHLKVEWNEEIDHPLKRTLRKTRKERDDQKKTAAELKRQAEELQQKFGDVNLDDYKAFVERQKTGKGGGEMPPKPTQEQLDQYYAKGLEKAKEKYEKQIKDLTDKRGEDAKLMENLMLDQRADALSLAAGIDPKKFEYVRYLARKQFQFDPKEKKLVARDENGDLIYGEDDVTHLTLDEWHAKLATKTETSWLFTESAGAETTDQTRRRPKVSPGAKIFDANNQDHINQHLHDPDAKFV